MVAHLLVRGGQHSRLSDGSPTHRALDSTQLVGSQLGSTQLLGMRLTSTQLSTSHLGSQQHGGMHAMQCYQC